MKTTRRLPIRSCQPGTKAQEGGRYGEGERELSLRWGGRQWRALPDCIKITHHCRVQVSASQQDITLWTAFSFQPTLQSKTSARFLLSCLFIYFFYSPYNGWRLPPPCLSLTFSFLFHRIYPNTLPSPRGSEQGISSIFITLPQHEIFSSRTFPFHLWHRELNNTLPRFTVILSISAPSNFLWV